MSAQIAKTIKPTTKKNPSFSPIVELLHVEGNDLSFFFFFFIQPTLVIYHIRF